MQLALLYSGQGNYPSGYGMAMRALKNTDRPIYYHVAHEPWGTQSHEMAAYCAFNMGYYAEAVRLYGQALSMVPGNTPWHATLKGNYNNSMKEVLKGKKIYQEIYSHLGDCWWFATSIMQLPPQKDKVYVSAIAEYLSLDIRKKLEEIFPLLENKNNLDIEIVDPLGVMVAFHKNWLTLDPVPTKLKWLGLDTGPICCQFKGFHMAELKNPTTEELATIMNDLKSYGLVELGPELSLEHVVKQLAAASLYIGCDNGISHMAVSVGIPAIIYVPEKANLDEGTNLGELYKKFKQVTVCRTVNELIKKTREFKSGETPAAPTTCIADCVRPRHGVPGGRRPLWRLLVLCQLHHADAAARQPCPRLHDFKKNHR